MALTFAEYELPPLLTSSGGRLAVQQQEDPPHSLVRAITKYRTLIVTGPPNPAGWDTREMRVRAIVWT